MMSRRSTPQQGRDGRSKQPVSYKNLVEGGWTPQSGDTQSSFPRPRQLYFQSTQTVDRTIAIMGVLAESWQTPYSAASDSHCALTGIRIGKPLARSSTPTSKKPSYHRLNRGVPPGKRVPGRGGPKDDSNPVTRSPTEETQGKNSQSHDRLWIEGESRTRVLLMDVLHSVPKAQRAGMSIPGRPVRIG